VNLNERLKLAMSDPKVTGTALSKACKVSTATVSEWLSGEIKEIKSTNLLAAAKFLNISPEWLASGVGPMRKTYVYEPFPALSVQEPLKTYEINLQNNPAYPAVKRVKFKLSAGISGFGVEYDEGDNTPLVFNRSWYEGNGYTPANLFAVSVSNGSMEPGLHHGDVVIVNTDSTTPKDGKVFAANYEGEMVIKRLVRDAGQWWLSSDNADQRRYPRKACDENCQIIGEIVHKQSEMI
jgi:phage repressor protein C with HTH and peptisase S24 domain